MSSERENPSLATGSPPVLLKEKQTFGQWTVSNVNLILEEAHLFFFYVTYKDRERYLLKPHLQSLTSSSISIDLILNVHLLILLTS